LLGLQKDNSKLEDPLFLRQALLDFIADLSNWDNSTSGEYLETSRKLTKASYPGLHGLFGSLPVVIDPFSGGGSIPLEAARIGAHPFATDLNPIPIILNKLMLEFVPKFGPQLAEEARRIAEKVKAGAIRELTPYYPRDPDGATPIAYIWGRTIQCEGPSCGVEVPVIRSLWLSKKANNSVGLQLVPNPEKKRVDLQLIVKQHTKWVDRNAITVVVDRPKFDGTVKRGSVTCPCCGHTTPVARVREQLKAQHGGANNARLMAVVTLRPGEVGRNYRLPNDQDLKACKAAETKLAEMEASTPGDAGLIPTETLPLMSGVFNAPIYGHTTWGSLFSHRQALSMAVLTKLVRAAVETASIGPKDSLEAAAATLVALAVSKHADLANALCAWEPIAQCPRHLFGRQAIGMVWDFAEGVAIGDSSGSAMITIDRIPDVIAGFGSNWGFGHVQQASATAHPLPDDSVQALVTDPPYYNAVPYADLSDFFYVWLRRSLAPLYPDLFKDPLAPKADEICEMSGWDPVRYGHKTSGWFEARMKEAMSEARRVVEPSGIGVVVFAHKSTAGWEAQLQAILDAGWVVTASWPIDTECGSRLRAMGSAVLGSSIHIVMRPRENPNGAVREDAIGDWREVLQELPRRIHEWMPRLAEEGVVGADAIFACIGPALEIYSKYSRVEKASGEVVALRDYLEQVWAAVAKEAMTLVFQGASAEGFEPDARLTAMWLWTLGTGEDEAETCDTEGEGDSDEDDGESNAKKVTGFTLEYDAARKIAQGLGASLADLPTLVEVRGDSARMFSVAERASHLFGKQTPVPMAARTRGRQKQEALPGFEEIVEESVGFGLGEDSRKLGQTVLDRIHQAMLLFGAGRSEALKTFLVDEGVGSDVRFWRLAQALSALYPRSTQEKRWVDGVLSRKKSLGF
jgi:adenine-specific DNA methylase